MSDTVIATALPEATRKATAAQPPVARKLVR
jgi:hypothetical protein